jgi:hypothetical protein
VFCEIHGYISLELLQQFCCVLLRVVMSDAEAGVITLFWKKKISVATI